MAKKKYYAIKKGKGVQNKIVETWAECEKLVLGYPAIYKSFKTEEEAKEYLGLNVKKKEKVENMEQEQIEKEPKKKKGKNERILKVCLNKELYKSFKEKCDEMDMSEDIIIKNMIMEWLE